MDLSEDNVGNDKGLARWLLFSDSPCIIDLLRHAACNYWWGALLAHFSNILVFNIEVTYQHFRFDEIATEIEAYAIFFLYDFNNLPCSFLNFQIFRNKLLRKLFDSARKYC